MAAIVSNWRHRSLLCDLRNSFNFLLFNRNEYFVEFYVVRSDNWVSGRVAAQRLVFYYTEIILLLLNFKFFLNYGSRFASFCHWMASLLALVYSLFPCFSLSGWSGRRRIIRLDRDGFTTLGNCSSTTGQILLVKLLRDLLFCLGSVIWD